MRKMYLGLAISGALLGVGAFAHSQGASTGGSSGHEKQCWGRGQQGSSRRKRRHCYRPIRKYGCRLRNFIRVERWHFLNHFFRYEYKRQCILPPSWSARLLARRLRPSGNRTTPPLYGRFFYHRNGSVSRKIQFR